MFKLIDSLFTALSYFILLTITLVLVVVGFANYPVVTGILVGCYVLSFFVPLLEKLPKPKAVDRLPKWLEPQTSGLEKTQQKLWQAFKDGFSKGHH